VGQKRRWGLGLGILAAVFCLWQAPAVQAKMDAYPYSTKPCVWSPHAVTGAKANWCADFVWGDKPKDLNAANVISPYGYYYRNCTDYAAWRVHTSGVSPQMYKGLGNASTWGVRAVAKGIKVNSKPTVGSVAVRTTGKYGHTAYVEAVYPNGTIKVSQYNNGAAGEYSESTGTPAALGFSAFVHFEAYMPARPKPPKPPVTQAAKPPAPVAKPPLQPPPAKPASAPASVPSPIPLPVPAKQTVVTPTKADKGDTELPRLASTKQPPVKAPAANPPQTAPVPKADKPTVRLASIVSTAKKGQRIKLAPSRTQGDAQSRQPPPTRLVPRPLPVKGRPQPAPTLASSQLAATRRPLSPKLPSPRVLSATDIQKRSTSLPEPGSSRWPVLAVMLLGGLWGLVLAWPAFRGKGTKP